MKFRYRNYIRNGWHEVEIPRQNLYDWDNDFSNAKFGNVKHYQDICAWCGKHIPPGKWVSSLHTPGKPGVKRFAFADEKYITLFRLMWPEL